MDSLPPPDSVRAAVFRGSLPVSVHFSPSECVDAGLASPPAPFHVMLPRCGYLPFLTDRALQHLRHAHLPVPEDEAELWYSDAADGRGLPWHLPVGLLYDLYGAGRLPWRLEMHARGYPHDQLLAPARGDTLWAQHMSMLKEADHLRHGSTGKVMRLSKEDQISLFTSLKSSDLEMFWGVNAQLVAGIPRHVPIRFYAAATPHTPYQALIPVNPSKSTTFQDVLEALPEEHFPGKRVGILHGVKMPGEMPLVWAAMAMGYGDNFLYITVRSG